MLKILIICFSLFSNSLWANEFDEGLKAFENENYPVAIEKFTSSGLKGDLLSQKFLGALYYVGFGVKQNYVESYRWTKLAAAQGDSKSQFNLAEMYFNGEGTDKKFTEAIRWWKLSSDRGNTEAFDKLTLIQGDPITQFTIGRMYYEGNDVLQNYELAFKLWNMAALQGLTVAQTNLGVMYSLGIGTNEDLVKAHMWFNISVANGNSDAVKTRIIVEKKMTTSEISAAQNLALRCLESNYSKCN